MSFKYKVLKKAVSYELANFCFNYLKLKREAVFFMYKNNIVNENTFLGFWNDAQFSNTYSCYADFVMETLLLKLLPIVEKHTNLKLVPTYSYTRLYKTGDELKRHKDRPSCEVSTTLCLGYNNQNLKDKKKDWEKYNWPMWVDETGGFGNKGAPIHMEPGDMIVYRGCIIEHWREPFLGNNHAQVFLHYNDVDGPFGENCVFDGRHHLGLPPSFKDPKKVQAMAKADANLVKNQPYKK